VVVHFSSCKLDDCSTIRPIRLCVQGSGGAGGAEGERRQCAMSDGEKRDSSGFDGADDDLSSKPRRRNMEQHLAVRPRNFRGRMS